MATKTEFLNKAMDLLDDGRCPTPQLGESAWGQLIALGRDLLSSDSAAAVEGPTPLDWVEVPPKVAGTYLFFGRTDSKETAPRTRLVHVVTMPGRNLPSYLCHGGEIYPFNAWSEIVLPGHWAAFTLPRPPGV